MLIHKNGFISILFQDKQITPKQQHSRQFQHHHIEKFVEENVFVPRNRLKHLRILKLSGGNSQLDVEAVGERKLISRVFDEEVLIGEIANRRGALTSYKEHREPRGSSMCPSPQSRQQKKGKVRQIKNLTFFEQKITLVKANNSKIKQAQKNIDKEFNDLSKTLDAVNRQKLGDQRYIQRSTACSSVKQMKGRPSVRYRRIVSPQKKESINAKAVLEVKRELFKFYSNPFCSPDNISAKAYIIYENSKDIKCKKLHLVYNSKIPLQIASLTKIMTCILTLEICERQNIDIQRQEIEISSFETKVEGTSAELEPNNIFTILQLLYGLMLPSGNDASLALSAFCGIELLKRQNKQLQNQKIPKRLGYLRFINQMNKRSQQIGMKKTFFTNSHGLANNLNKSCGLDLAILIQHCLNRQLFRSIVGSTQYDTTIIVKKKNQFQKKRIRWENTHKLIPEMPQFYKGIKTGTTEAAGPCLASLVEYKSREFIIVVLNSKSLKFRYKDTQNLRQWLFKKEGWLCEEGAEA